MKRPLLLLTSLFVAGCASVSPRGALPQPQPLPAELRAYYDYPAHATHSTMQLLQETRRFRQFLVRFPLTATDFEPTEPVVEFEWFESKAPGRRPAILFNPILGGDYPLERGVCTYFAAHGLQVALVHRKTLKLAPEQPVDHIERLLRQGVLRIRQIVDWMERSDRVDPARLGSFGISMGGMVSVVTAAVEPRVRCHVVALAGGPIADILATSHDTLLAKPRARYLAANGMDLTTLAARLQETIRTDPVRLAPYVDSNHLFMVIALADRTIGRANALRLWRALGRPRAAFLPLGHYTAYLALPYLKHASLRFFQEQLISTESVVHSR